MNEEFDAPVLLSWEEYWSIAVRRRWWILLPLFLTWATVWGVSWFLPQSYQSESLILVEQQKVPDQYVVPNVTNNLQERLQNLTEQILSRTRLQDTIDRLHLNSRRGGLSSSNDPVEEMRNNIKIDLVSAPEHPGDFTAFKMRYTAGTPELAQQVNSELSSLFIAENVTTQRQLSEDTTDFLQAQVADAKANMAEQEAKVAAFKSQHLGELPTQMESNVQILAGLQSQLQNSQRSLDAARQQKLYLESLMQSYQSAASLVGDNSSNTPESLEMQLAAMRLKLRDMQTRYTEGHPDVIALKQQIAETERLKKQAEAEVATSKKDPSTAGSVEISSLGDTQHGSPTPIMQVQSQLKANQLEIANIQQHEKELEKQISGYQGRLNLAPETEQELTSVSRGYEESKANYNSLLQKQMQSKLATNLEQRQQGEQFHIVDPPSLPKKPSAPNHLLFSLAGLAAGIVLGLGLTVLAEITNVRVRREKDLEGIVPAGILVDIPHLSTLREARHREQQQFKELVTAVAMVVVIVAGNLYALYRG